MAKNQLKKRQILFVNKIKTFINPEEKNAAKIWKSFSDELKDYDLILIDTAGRHTLDKELIEEIKTQQEGAW